MATSRGSWTSRRAPDQEARPAAAGARLGVRRPGRKLGRVTQTASAPRTAESSLWLFVVARAVPALVIGAVITFSADHSQSLGLASFAALALLGGGVLVLAAVRGAVLGADRSTMIVQGSASMVAGIAAAVLAATDLPFFLPIVSLWAAVTGALELSLGWSNRGRHAASRDWIFVGALTVVFAVVAFLIPADLQDSWANDAGVEGVLTASVVSVGALGAYAAVVGVYLVIAGLSLKWAVGRPPVSEAEGTERS